MGKIILFIIVVIITQTCTQVPSEVNYLCTTQDNCGSCVTKSKECLWCSDTEFNERNSRCNSFEKLSSFGCPVKSIRYANEPYSEYTEDLPFVDIVSRKKSKPIQIKPQKVSIGLSPFEPQKLSFEYRPTKNFPLDLYYLMDLTFSMKDDKDTLLGLRNDLPPFLGNLTTNFRLGFGSFADKPLLPYTATTEERINNPCLVESDTCEATYAYRHRLSLTETVDTFLDAVRNSSITGNLDNAEGGLEALMQVMNCNEKVGWRDVSRKIVIFATDGILHYAGDGILGGAVQPNDKQCYLNSKGEYTAAKYLDYPSLEQVYRVMLEKKVSVIFAVTKEVVPYYNNIKSIFPDYVFVGTLSNDSSNILNLVKHGYESLVNIIKFEDDSDEDVELIYSSNCGVPYRPFVQSSKCEGVTIGETYKFNVDIVLSNCPKDKANYKKQITISEVQLGQESMLLDVQLLCDCDCEDAGEKLCPENSNLECGKCVCSDGWSGNNCDCNAEKYEALKTTDDCKRPGDVLSCSGVGDCLCDTCYCDVGFDGKYCQCTACPVDVSTNATCGGSNRGTCSCGTCACRESWFGATCSCSESLCLAPWENTQCSGHGACTCGGCECWTINDEQYTGKYCETCANCVNPACSLYEDCVKCVVTKNCTKDSCKMMNSDMMYKLENTPIESFNVTSVCVLRLPTTADETVKEYKYTYSQINGKPFLTIFPHSDMFVMAGFNSLDTTVSVGVSIVLIGILCIAIYKIRLYISEQREFKLFEADKLEMEEEMQARIENPIYRSPITNFVVPDGYGEEEKID